MPIPLEPNGYYHIYNHANGSDNLFVSDDNYQYFLSKYAHYIRLVADTFCYCLLPNHFHFLLRIKSENALEPYLLSIIKNNNKTLSEFETLTGLERQNFISNFVSRQFSHLFNGYTQAYNKLFTRKGSLFNRPFKRKLISDEKYLRKLVHYIHYNPVEHGFCEKPEDWKYSSFNAVVSCKPTSLKRDEVIEWFDELDNFIYCHRYPPILTGIE